LEKTYKKKGSTKTETPARKESAAGLTGQSEVVTVVWGLAEPICNVDGMELIHVEYQREVSGRILRLYVDKPGGITLGDCSLISSQLGDILDLKLETKDAYTLEVSSPGIDRPVSKLSDFEKFEGQQAKIKIARPINGQKKFKGILSGIMESSVQLKTDKDTVSIPYQDIIKARLVNYDGENKCL
jgi:ribosome maturation factor RimP